MNALYQSISRRIAWGFIKNFIDGIEKDPKFSLKTLKHPLSQNDSQARDFIFKLTHAIREGIPEQEIKNTFTDEYVKIITRSLYVANKDGILSRNNLRDAFDQYRSISYLKDLTERDFFLFLAYTFCNP